MERYAFGTPLTTFDQHPMLARPVSATSNTRRSLEPLSEAVEVPQHGQATTHSDTMSEAIEATPQRRPSTAPSEAPQHRTSTTHSEARLSMEPLDAMLFESE